MAQVLSIAKDRQLDPLTCPHCGAGKDGITLGLFWDSRERSWRCLICSHRTFERRKRSQAEILEDMMWDRVLAAFDQEEEANRLQDEEEEF